MRKNSRITLVLATTLALFPLVGLADVAVFVGYADDVRPSPFFPNPWSGDPNITFVGNASNIDAGAILIENTGASAITLDHISVVVPTWNSGGANANDAAGGIWFGTTGFSIAPGHGAIFTQTSPFNFDTSDFGVGGLNAANNCDPSNAFAIANAALCASIAPTITLTIDGSALPMFIDSGQVLDTGGFDFVNADPCPVAGDSPGSCNESLQWRLVGTTGISNPGGTAAPEPAMIGLVSLAMAIAGLAGWRRRS